MTKKFWSLGLLVLVGLTVIIWWAQRPLEQDIFQSENAEIAMSKSKIIETAEKEKYLEKKEKKVTRVELAQEKNAEEENMQRELSKELLEISKIEFVPGKDPDESMGLYLNEVGRILGNIKERSQKAKNDNELAVYESFYEECSHEKSLITPVLALCLKNYIDIANRRGKIVELKNYPLAVLELVEKM